MCREGIVAELKLHGIACATAGKQQFAAQECSYAAMTINPAAA